MNPREIITFKNDYYFPFQLRLMAWLGIIMGFALIVGGSVIFGIILFPLSLFFGLAKSGVQLDITNKQFRNLPFVVGKNSGWESLNNYVYITILKSNASNPSHDLYLMSSNHQDKLLLQRFKTRLLAHKEVELLAGNLRFIFINK